jgi:hypothetical protein
MRAASITPTDEAVPHGWYGAFLRFTSAVVHFGALFPVLWLASFYAFIIRIRVLAGEWPPDAGGYSRFSDAFQLHERFISWGVFVLPFVFISWLPIAGFAAFMPRAMSGRRFLGLLALWLSVPAIALLDPLHLLEWYFLSSE